jgi:hypothetical protein
MDPVFDICNFSTENDRLLDYTSLFYFLGLTHPLFYPFVRIHFSLTNFHITLTWVYSLLHFDLTYFQLSFS